MNLLAFIALIISMASGSTWLFFPSLLVGYSPSIGAPKRR